MLHFFEPFKLNYINPTPKIYTTIFEEISDFSHTIGEKKLRDVTNDDICLITPFVFIGRSIEVYDYARKYLLKNRNRFNYYLKKKK